jgi:hypothetical protein
MTSRWDIEAIVAAAIWPNLSLPLAIYFHDMQSFHTVEWE